MAASSEFIRTFEEQRYVVIPSLIGNPLLSVMYAYAMKMAHGGKMDEGDKLCKESLCLYGDTLMDSVLDLLRPDLEAGLGLQLHQTYSYFRVYREGELLPPHKDREACEISLTICIGFEAPEPWPISIEGPNGIAEVPLQPGDALIYRGCECMHWREPFNGNHHVQCFLHYVDQNGPNADVIYDKRKMEHVGILV